MSCEELKPQDLTKLGNIRKISTLAGCGVSCPGSVQKMLVIAAKNYFSLRSYKFCISKQLTRIKLLTFAGDCVVQG